MKVRSLREAVAFQLSEQETLAKVVGVPLSQHKLRRAAHLPAGPSTGSTENQSRQGRVRVLEMWGQTVADPLPPSPLHFPHHCKRKLGCVG